MAMPPAAAAAAAATDAPLCLCCDGRGLQSPMKPATDTAGNPAFVPITGSRMYIDDIPFGTLVDLGLIDLGLISAISRTSELHTPSMARWALLFLVPTLFGC